MVLDESHVTVPQINGQFAGDKSRKDVSDRSRVPPALGAGQPPAAFDEWYDRTTQAVLLSATPSKWELRESPRSSSRSFARRALSIPRLSFGPTKGQIDDLVGEIQNAAAHEQRVLVTTLTKKMSEDLTDYLLELGVRARYLHSDIDTLETCPDPSGPASGGVRRPHRGEPAARGARSSRGLPWWRSSMRTRRASCGQGRASSRRSDVRLAMSTDP